MKGLLKLAPNKPPQPRPRAICSHCLRPRAETHTRIHPLQNTQAKLCLNCYGDLKTMERLKRSGQTSIAETALNISLAQTDKV